MSLSKFTNNNSKYGKLYCWYSYFTSFDNKFIDGFLQSFESIVSQKDIDHIFVRVTIPSSLDQNIATNILESFNDDRCTITYHFSDDVSHFNNYDFIRKSDWLFLDNDRIIFMYDDDLLLRLPKISTIMSEEVIFGQYYVPDKDPENFTSTVNHVLTNEETLSKKWTVESDFSGYIVKFPIVDEYFKERNKESLKTLNIVRTIEEVYFISFTDKFCVINPPKPTIFHRMFDQTEQWKVESAKSIEQIIQIDEDDL